MAAGLIYALIVLVWAAVLLPRWTRRHSDAAAERFPAEAAKTRVLSREGRARGSRAGHGDASVRLRREAEARTRVRRARVLAGLLLALVVTAVLGMLSVVPLAVPAILGVLLGGYVVALRRVTVARRRAEAALRRRRVPAPPRMPQAQLPHPPEDVDQAAAARDASSASAADPLVIDLRDGADRTASGGSGENWEPRETPLPTYVSKNEMHRRSIILGGGAFGPADAEGSADWTDPSTGKTRGEDGSTGSTRAVND